MTQNRNRKNTAPPGTAAIYARFSSHNQREVSIEQQVKACQAYAERVNLRVTECYADKAISGKTDRRPSFQRMMEDAHSRKFQYVIAWKSNRMGRNMLQAMANESALSEYGIRCLYVEEDFDNTAAGRFALRNMMNVNQFYSENMAEDIMRGLLDNAEKCMVNSGTGFGYQRGQDGRYQVVEEDAAIVREIFNRVNEDESYASIAADLNARGLRTVRGNPWNKGSFHRMLRSERYIGIYEYAGIRKEDGVPPIISKELFYSVQENLKKRAGSQRHRRNDADYLLTGKLFCGHCGAYMTGISGTSKNGTTHYYYICQKRRNEKNCSKENVRKEWIEQKVVQAVRDYIMQDSVINWICDGYEEFLRDQRADSALVSAQEELSGVDRSISNIMSAIEQGIITSTTRSRLLELESEHRRLEMVIAIEKAAQVDVDRNMIQFWLESFRDGDVRDEKYQSQIIELFVQSIYLYDKELRIAFNYCDKNSTKTIPYSDISSLSPTTSPVFDYAPQRATK